MARPKPEKKPVAAPLTAIRVLPMELQIGDRLTDETGEWELVSRPYSSSDGETASVRVRRVDQLGRPEVTEIRTWSAHDRIEVKRT